MKGYLDNAATAMPLPEAVAAATRAMTEEFGNPSSIHGLGRRAAGILEQARGQVAAALGCQPGCIFFNSGGTESANTAIASIVRKGRHIGRHVITTQVEHSATLKALAELEQEGIEVTRIAPGRDGAVAAADILDALRPDTVLVAMQAVNNETGAIMPYDTVAAGLAGTQALLYLDLVPAFCKLELNLSGVAMAALSAHKIGGIKGSGALYVAEGLRVRPLLHGGGQEGGLRPGTQAIPAIAAFGAACAHRSQSKPAEHAHLDALKAYLLEQLKERDIAHVVNSPLHSVPHIVNISLTRGRTEIYIRVLEEQGVYISGGSACAKGKKSPVLLAMKLTPNLIDAALRISFCPENTFADIDLLCRGLKEAEALF